MADNANENFPVELTDTIQEFHEGLCKLEEMFQPMFDCSKTEVSENLESLDLAKFDLVSLYAINSLHWMYLRTCGENPSKSSIKNELTRVKDTMVQLKQVQDSSKRGTVDTDAAKRFVSSALWKPGERKQSYQGGNDGPSPPKIKKFD